MIRKTSKRSIFQKLAELEKLAPSDKPYIVFIDPLPDGKYEVTEHIGVGVADGRKKLYKSVKFIKKIVDDPQDYLDQNPDLDCTVIIDDGLEDLDDEDLEEVIEQASTEDLEAIIEDEDGSLGEKYVVSQLRKRKDEE